MTVSPDLGVALRERSRILILLGLNTCLILLYVFLSYVPAGQDFVASVMHGAASTEAHASITAVQAVPLAPLDPQALAPENAVALGLVFEPLVRFDEYFNLTSALAYAWHWRDDTHFVVQINSRALFSDGSTVSCADVAQSLLRAQQYSGSSVRDYFAGIHIASESSGRTCVFTLPQADRDFARKLTRLYIVQEKVAAAHLAAPLTDAIGTGLYAVQTKDAAHAEFAIVLHHPDYNPNLPRVITIRIEPQKYRRLALVKDGTADILLDTPAMFARQIKRWNSHTIVKVPTYESIFIMFNLKNTVLADRHTRTYLADAIRSSGTKQMLVDDGLYALNQFAPTGVFGFNTDIPSELPDRPEPLTDKIFLTLGLTQANKKIGEILHANLLPLNVNLDIKVLSQDELSAAVRAGTVDLALIGWRYDLGSVESFFCKSCPLAGRSVWRIEWYWVCRSGN